MNLLLRYYSLKRLHLFIVVVLLNLVIIWLSKSILINETVFYNTYSEQLTYDRAMNLFNRMKDISWLGYAFTPVILLIKFSLVSMILYTGVVFCNLQGKISLGSVFKIVIASEIIFVFAGFVKFLWFYLFAGNYDLNDLGFFYPVSLINLFKNTEVNSVWRYPLQTVNIFHLLYILLLSFGFSSLNRIDRKDSEKIVLLSYLPTLILWVVLVMFISIDGSL
jgi:hypothetical protein